MASRKTTGRVKSQAFSQICPWIESRDKDLAEAIRHLCMEGSITGGRRNGVTFLYPSKQIRDKIVDATYSDAPEDAISLLDAHIIPSLVVSAAEFERGVGSRGNVKLELKKGGGKSVVLANGAELRLAEDFKPLRRDNAAVWEVVSGEVPTEGTVFKMPRKHRSRDDGVNPSTRQSLRLSLEESLKRKYIQFRGKESERTEDPYLVVVVSLLNYLKMRQPNTLAAVSPLLDRDPMTSFHILVEPFKDPRGSFLISDHVLEKWGGVVLAKSPVAEFEQFLEAGAKLISKSTLAVRKAVDKVRLQIVGEDGSRANKVKTPSDTIKAYRLLVEKNTIGGLGPVLPEATLQLVPGLKKLWQDELRFIVHPAMEDIRRAVSFEPSEFLELCSTLADRPGNDYGKELLLADPDKMKQDVSVRQAFVVLLKFIASTDFLHLPVPKEQIGKSWGPVPSTSDESKLYNVRDLSVFNAERSKQKRLESFKGLDAKTLESRQVVIDFYKE